MPRKFPFDLLDEFSTVPIDQLGLRGSPDELFGGLLRHLAGVEPTTETEEEGCSEELAKRMRTLCTEAARRGMKPEELRREIEAGGEEDGGNRIKEAFLRAYEENFEALQKAMKATMPTGVYPEVVGIDWSIFSVIESTNEAEYEEPLAEITFKTICPPSGEPGTTRLVCNKNQLQDFHWKVKEACNFVQKLAAKEN